MITDYRHVSTNELRDDLRRVRGIAQYLNVNDIPDGSVKAFHMLVRYGGDKEAPAWFAEFCEDIVNLWRDGEMDNQMKVEQLRQALRENAVTGGWDLEEFYAEAGD